MYSKQSQSSVYASLSKLTSVARTNWKKEILKIYITNYLHLGVQNLEQKLLDCKKSFFGGLVVKISLIGLPSENWALLVSSQGGTDSE